MIYRNIQRNVIIDLNILVYLNTLLCDYIKYRQTSIISISNGKEHADKCNRKPEGPCPVASSFQFGKFEFLGRQTRLPGPIYAKGSTSTLAEAAKDPDIEDAATLKIGNGYPKKL